MSLFGHKDKSNKETIKPAKSKKKVSNIEISEDIKIAIGMSLYLYFNERHDTDSDILTIKNNPHDYSPWNSKIFGINNII